MRPLHGQPHQATPPPQRWGAALPPLLALGFALFASGSVRAETPMDGGTAVARRPDAGPAAPAADEACPSYNLIARSRVVTANTKGNSIRVRDGHLVTEGSVWNSPFALVLNKDTSIVTFDLRAERDVGYLALQGDNNDRYQFSSSLDGKTYEPLWVAAVVPDSGGLRTRHTKLPKKVRARYLRVKPKSGDDYYSISEVQAYCEPSAGKWPPKLKLPPRKVGWAAITNPIMVAVKGVTAAVGAAILLWFWALLWRGRPKKHRATRDVSLALVGLLSLANWWNLGHFHFDHYIHIWEHYHYYVGAKYPELRYSRIYECTAVADMEDGLRARVKKRKMRALDTDNKLGTTEEIMRNPQKCKEHFEPARWKAFKKDIRFFRGRFSRDRWDQSQNDHGYNATPVWAVAGRLIAENTDISWKRVTQLGYIDSGLLGLMWLMVWWAFGWRATCVALIYWGCNFPARYYWNGGSFLRYDYLFWMISGVCFLKKRWHAAGGAALTYATLLRIFPGFVVAAIVLKVLYRMGRERRFVLSREHMSFAGGCILAMGVLIPASGWATNGLDAWPQFVENSQKHLKTALTNNMGLKTVMGYDYGTRARVMRNNDLSDPFDQWKDARAYFYHKRMPIFLGLIFLFCIILARAGDRDEDWVAACLGTGLIAMAAELTCYYYCFLLTYGLLWERRKLPGVAAAMLAGATCWLSEIAWNDDHFAAMSVAYTVVIVGVTAHAAFGKMPGEAAAPALPAPPAAPPQPLGATD